MSARLRGLMLVVPLYICWNKFNFEKRSSLMLKKMTVFIALLTFLLLLAVCGSDGNNNSNNGEKTGSQNHQEYVDIDEDELAGEDEIVAVVNDTDILESTYYMFYNRTITADVQMGEE